MRKISRRKPFHRHLLAATVATLIAAPAAFAHDHHASASHHLASRASFGHGHHSLNNRQDESRYANSQDRDVQTVASETSQRKHERVPDEEELEQAEQ